MIPLKCNGKWTIWKFQWMKIKGNFFATLTSAKKEHRLTCVDLSRATKLIDIDLLDRIAVTRSSEKLSGKNQKED